ncbi:MAG: hypothetical protein CMI31_09225 [Opitutae bacterium]|nr:hypothetical protein [Opitutae bacterium]
MARKFRRKTPRFTGNTQNPRLRGWRWVLLLTGMSVWSALFSVWFLLFLVGCGEDAQDSVGVETGDENGADIDSPAVSKVKPNTEALPLRQITVRATGVVRVLIQQLDQSADLLVKDMQAGEEAMVEARGRFKVFCSAREHLKLDIAGQSVEFAQSGPGVAEF